MEEFYDDGYVPEEEDFYDDSYISDEERQFDYMNDPNRPYNPDVEWGGSDKMSVTAMWMGDYAAEMYC